MLLHLLRSAHGTPFTGSYLSYDRNATDGDALKFNFGVGTQYNNSLPFNLDLADAIKAAGLPDFLSNLVGVSASGNLGVSLSANLALVLGIGLTKNKDQGNVFLYTGDDGTRITAHAGASGNNLDFRANIGPFNLFVVNGTGSLSGDIKLELNNNGPDEMVVSLLATSSRHPTRAMTSTPIRPTSLPAMPTSTCRSTSAT
jgi:hypothetical protein